MWYEQFYYTIEMITINKEVAERHRKLKRQRIIQLKLFKHSEVSKSSQLS